MISQSRPAEELDYVLNDPRTREEPHNKQREILLDAARCVADALEDDDPGNLHMYIDRTEPYVRQEFRQRRPEYERVLKKRVIDKLPRPHSVTLRELSRLFFEHMLVRDAEFNDAYVRFATLAWSLADDTQRTAPFSIARHSRDRKKPFDNATLRALVNGELSGNDLTNMLEYMRQNDEQRNLNTIPPGTILWGPILPCGPHLKVIGCMPSKYSGERDPDHKNDEMIVFAALEGEMSPSAARRLSKELKPLVRSICQSYSLVYLRPSIRRESGWLIALHDDDVGQWKCFVRQCLDHYFADPAKGSIELRTRNAIHLIVEADRQERRAIGLALCMTALDALLGKDEGGASRKLAEKAGTLLEPNEPLRSQAKKIVQRLYDLRSRVLHGDRRDVDEQSFLNTRLLVSGALKSVLEWSCHVRSVEDHANATPDTLFDRLKTAANDGKPLLGVPDLQSVRQLWREPAGCQSG